jgi:hypothetical protein
MTGKLHAARLLENDFMRRFSVSWLALVLALLLLDGAVAVWGFAEEALGFRDPKTGITYTTSAGYPEISTLHDDLTYALALAAGFTVTDSQKLQIWDQLTDSEMLPSDVVSYTNCLGSFYASPDPNALFPIQCLGGNCSNVIWPMTGQMKNPNTCTTSRYGVYSPFFHFPHRTGPLAERDLGALRDWAWGFTTTLVAYEAYAWGRNSDLTVMQAKKQYTRTAVITTTLKAGALESFGTYLHSLADAYSHEACIAAMDALTTPVMLWATHSNPNLGDPSVPECDYRPNNPNATDVHGVEFGSDITGTQRTINAALAVYDELSRRSVLRDGVYHPLGLSTTLVVSGTSVTLADAITHFVRDRDYTDPTYRRQYADSLAAAVLAQPRALIQRVRLPIILK